MSSSGGGSAALWRGDGTKNSSHVKPTFLRIFSACRAAASASPSCSEPNRPHTRASRCRSTSAVTLPQPRRPGQRDEVWLFGASRWGLSAPPVLSTVNPHAKRDPGSNQYKLLDFLQKPKIRRVPIGTDRPPP